MARRASRERAAFWRELVERRRQSSLSVAQFCEQAGVSAASFYQWQRKLRASSRRPARGVITAQPAGGTLVPIRILPDPPAAHRNLNGRNSGGTIEIELPGPIRLRVPCGCDRATLELVLSVLLDDDDREAG